jgi:fimbrial chaperone protein
VGSTVPLGASEASYRIYVEELPPEESTPKPGEIRVLSRFGIPVFVLPLKSQPDLRLHGVEVGGGRVTVSLENHGNVHTRLKSVVMRAVDASGGLLLTRALNGWYVLAGGERRYEIPLDPDACRNASRVQVEILGDAGKLDGTAEELAGACGR